MTRLDTVARHHAEEVSRLVAGSPLPQLDSRRHAVRTFPSPAGALVVVTGLVLAFSLPFVFGSDQAALDVPVAATPTPQTLDTLAPSVNVDVGPAGGFVPTGLLSQPCDGCDGVRLKDGRVLVIGTSWAEIYDPRTWTFTPLEEAPVVRTAGSMDALLLEDGRVLVTGMSSDPGNPTVIEVFDPESETFLVIEPHTRQTGREARSTLFALPQVAAVGLLDGRVLILDHTGAGPNPVIFDPVTDRFSTPGQPTLSSHIAATVLEDGRVLVFGVEGKTELYDPVTDTFTRGSAMINVRYGFVSTRLGNGRVLIVGGSDGVGPLASAELFDPETGAFAVTASMAMGRHDPAAALLADGRVLVVGGGGSDSDPDASRTAEIYDPATEQFTAAPPPTTSRESAMAVPLADDTVLVLGPGEGNNLFPDVGSTSAEIFTYGSVEQPEGCCAPNPTVLTIAEVAGSDPGRVHVVIPPGALVGAIALDYYFEYQVDEQTWNGQGGELPLPTDCSQGCEIVIPEAKGTVHVQIGYLGPTPDAAALIRISVES